MRLWRNTSRRRREARAVPQNGRGTQKAAHASDTLAWTPNSGRASAATQVSRTLKWASVAGLPAQRQHVLCRRDMGLKDLAL